MPDSDQVQRAEPEHHAVRAPTAPHHATDERAAAPDQHPLLALQQQAGNAAVVRLLGVQRHTLDPEEESGV